MWTACIEIRPAERCMSGADLTLSPSCDYATSRTFTVPSGSTRTMKGSAVVAIGVGRDQHRHHERHRAQHAPLVAPRRPTAPFLCSPRRRRAHSPNGLTLELRVAELLRAPS